MGTIQIKKVEKTVVTGKQGTKLSSQLYSELTGDEEYKKEPAEVSAGFLNLCGERGITRRRR